MAESSSEFSFVSQLNASNLVLLPGLVLFNGNEFKRWSKHVSISLKAKKLIFQNRIDIKLMFKPFECSSDCTFDSCIISATDIKIMWQFFIFLIKNKSFSCIEMKFNVKR